MSKKQDKRLQKIADELQFSFDKQSETLFGTFNEYKVCLKSINETLVFDAMFSLKQNGELPNREELKAVVKESKIISQCRVQGYQVFFTLKTGMRTSTSIDNLDGALDIITHFLKEHSFDNCCQDCGTNEGLSFYSVAGIVEICCEACFKKQSEAIYSQTQAENQKKESVVTGLVGAFLGSLVGVATIVLLGQLGYVAAASGLVLAICTLKGYEILGKKVSGLGILLCSILMIVMVYFGIRLDWSISLANFYEDLDILTAFRIFPDFISEGYIDANSFYGDVILLYLFTALGAIPTVIGFFKEKNTKLESYKLG